MDIISLNSESELYDILVQGNFESNFKLLKKNKNGYEIEALKYPLYFLFHSEKQDKIKVYIKKNKVIDISDSFEYLKFSKEYPEIEKMISEFSTYIKIEDLSYNRD
jgi:hypothetical protein